MIINKLIKVMAMTGALAVWALMSSAQATVVQFQTVMGDFEVNLFDEITPETVANFLQYVEEGAYSDTFMHRLVPDFIIQGGGFAYDVTEQEVVSVSQHEAVVNEPYLSNVRGTIAMAKRGSGPNTATSQWFFNLADNSENLDHQNGGFTVFGQVSDEGLAILDAMAALNIMNGGGVFSNLPIRDYSADDAANEVLVNQDHLVMINAVVVLDASPDSAADLNPEPSIPAPEPKRRKRSGALTGTWLLLFTVLGVEAARRRRCPPVSG